jgi:hypothetical protein
VFLALERSAAIGSPIGMKAPEVTIVPLTIDEQNFTVAEIGKIEHDDIREVAERCYRVIEELTKRLIMTDESLFTEVTFKNFDSSGPITDKAKMILVAEHKDMRLYYTESHGMFSRHHQNTETGEWTVYVTATNAWDVFPFRDVVNGLLRIKAEARTVERENHKKLTNLAETINSYLDEVEALP